MLRSPLRHQAHSGVRWRFHWYNSLPVQYSFTLEFDRATPSFTLRKSFNSTFFMTLSYLSFSETKPDGTVVNSFQVSDLSFKYSYANSTTQNNTLNLQRGIFKHFFESGAQLTFHYVVATFTPSDNKTVLQLELFDTSVEIFAHHPACFFQLSLEDWAFEDMANTLTARTLVIINLSGLSIAAVEEATAFVLGLPYYNNYLSAKFPKISLIDNHTVPIRPEYHINSISQPVSATFAITIPSFHKFARYTSSMVTKSYNNPPPNTIEVVLIVMGVLVGLTLVLIGLGVYLKRTQDENDQQVEIVDDEEKKRLRLIQQMQYDSFERSLGRRS